MLTPRQEDLLKRFFVGISMLDEAGERYKPRKAKDILKVCVTTDFIKADDLDEMTKCEPNIVERQHLVFEQLASYQKSEKLSRILSNVVVICIVVFAFYQFFESGWMWGVGTLVLVPIGAFVSNMIFLTIFAPGFSPLALGLTHTECRFACDEIVGHSRWNE
jgi:hypothetical protein